MRKKWDQFKGWWEATVAPAWNGMLDGFGSIGEAIGGADYSGFTDKFDSIKAGFESFRDWFAGIWGNISDLFGPQIKKIWDSIVNAFGPAVDEVRKALSQFGPMIEPAKSAFTNLWNILKPIFGAIGAAVALVGSVMLNVFGNVIGPAIEMIGGVISGALQFIRGFVQLLIDLFTGNFTKMGGDLVTMFTGIWASILAVLNGAWQAIVGIVTGIVQGIYDWFDWLKEILVGHSIIPDMINAIVEWFQNAWNWIVEKVSGMVNAVIEWFQNLWNSVVEKVTGLWNAVTATWTLIRDTISNKASEIWTNVTGWFQSIWDDVCAKVAGLQADTLATWTLIRDTISTKANEIWTNVTGWFQDTWDDVCAKVTGLKDDTIETWTLIRKTISTKASEIWTNVTNWFQSIWDDVCAKVTGLKDDTVATWELIRKTISDKAAEIWQNVVDKFNEIVAWLSGFGQRAKDALGDLKDKMVEVARSAFQGLKDKAVEMVDGADGFMTWVGGIAGRVGTALAGIGSSVANSVKDAWNGAADWINTNAITNINKVMGIFKLEVPNLGKFAKGGIIPGGQSRTDNMLIAARSGEGVLVPEAVRAIGGASGLAALNSGGRLPGFKDGGIIGNISGAWSSVTGTIGDVASSITDWLASGTGNALSKIITPLSGLLRKSIPGDSFLENFAAGTLNTLAEKAKNWGNEKDKTSNPANGGGQVGTGVGSAASLLALGRLLQSMGFTVTENPAFGGVHGGHASTANGGMHYLGRAIDINHGAGTSKAEQAALYSILDLVHSYGLSTKFMVEGHRNHMHAQYDNGGWMKQGMGIFDNQSGSPEPVFSAMQWTILKSLISKSSDVLTSNINKSDKLDMRPTVTHNTYNFNGNLEFPNIKSGDDAEVFIRNLETLVGGGSR